MFKQYSIIFLMTFVFGESIWEYMLHGSDISSICFYTYVGGKGREGYTKDESKLLKSGKRLFMLRGSAKIPPNIPFEFNDADQLICSADGKKVCLKLRCDWKGDIDTCSKGELGHISRQFKDPNSKLARYPQNDCKLRCLYHDAPYSEEFDVALSEKRPCDPAGNPSFVCQGNGICGNGTATYNP